MIMKMADDKKMSLFITLLYLNVYVGFGAIISVTYDKTTHEYKIHPYEVSDWVALSEFKNDINSTG